MKNKILEQVADFLGFSEIYEEDCVSTLNDDNSKDKEQNKVVKLHSYPEKELFIIKPEKFEEAAVIADKLKAQYPVILNLQDTELALATKILDFLSGVSYALDGYRKKLGQKMFLFTPQNMKINNCQKNIERELNLDFLSE